MQSDIEQLVKDPISVSQITKNISLHFRTAYLENKAIPVNNYGRPYAAIVSSDLLMEALEALAEKRAREQHGRPSQGVAA